MKKSLVYALLTIIIFTSSCTASLEREAKERIMALQPASILCGTKDLTLYEQPQLYASQWNKPLSPCTNKIDQLGKQYYMLNDGKTLKDGEYANWPIMQIEYKIPDNVDPTTVISSSIKLDLICSIRLVFMAPTKFGELKPIEGYTDASQNQKDIHNTCADFTQTEETIFVPVSTISNKVVLMIQPAQYNSVTKVLPQQLYLTLK